MIENNLTSIQTIKEVLPIEKADRLQLVTFEDVCWQSVVLKDKFAIGDKAVYIPIDTTVDVSKPYFSFLEKDSKEGRARIKTIRLRQELSQGLTISLSEIGEITDESQIDIIVGVEKYSKPYSGSGRQSNWPSEVIKTNSERLQNYPKLLQELEGVDVYVNEKADGCLRGDTLVKTPDGEVRIDGIKVGDRVIGYTKDNEEKTTTVTSTFKSNTGKKWFKLKTNQGKELIVTGNHKIFIPSLGIYRRTDDLSIGDQILLKKVGKLPTFSVVSIVEVIENEYLSIL